MSKAANVGEQEVTMDRRRQDRRETSTSEVAGEPKPARRKKQRRRQIDPTTCERDYNDKEIEFMHALDEYKRNAGRMFPTCSEILEVVRGLGYIKLMEEEEQLLASINEVEEELAEVLGSVSANNLAFVESVYGNNEQQQQKLSQPHCTGKR